ncbi:MAG: 30S ribosomal protein S17 [Nitrospinae bacterium]|nr:30S ribosomal protein S17 [Nitrospinota bacterium]
MADVQHKRKTRVGQVVSNKMDKTIVVKIERKMLHPVFKKFIKRTKKYVAHDKDNKCQVGDVVEIEETRPMSKTKRWKVVSIVSSIRSEHDTASVNS